MKPYVHSNYERKAGDDYKTIDPRCTQALYYRIPIYGRVVDCCAPDGSGIVDVLLTHGIDAGCVGDAFSEFDADWVVTNPPFKRGLVDEIIKAQIYKVENGKLHGFAALLRNNFDFAKSRYDMFTCSSYWGQVHMMFRPWWSEEKKHQPIHNYVWHVWGKPTEYRPFVKYWREE